MTQKTKSQRTKLEMLIGKQNQYIQHIENTIDEIILANQELEKFQNFQNNASIWQNYNLRNLNTTLAQLIYF